MSRADEEILAQASAWHVASATPDMDWDGFTAWLEADPRHRHAFDEIALTDALLQDSADRVVPAWATPDPVHHLTDEEVRDRRSPRRLWAIWSGAAIAASLAAVLVVQEFSAAPAQIYETGAKGRTIALDDGSRIELAPRSRLQISGARQDAIALDGGAWFEIRHDPDRQLAIQAGGISIQDIGTNFDVQSAGGQVRIEVAQGQLSVAGAALAKPIRLSEGQGLTFDPAGGTAEVARLGEGQVGEWRKGRLSFEGAPLALVAADLNRYADVRVTLGNDLSDRHFTGTLVIGDGQAALRDLSQLMDVELGRSGDSYRLESRKR